MWDYRGPHTLCPSCRSRAGVAGGGRQSESMCTVWLADQAAVVANHCSGQPAKIRSKT